MSKYERLRKAISAHDTLKDIVKLQLPPAASDQQLLRVHTSAYLEALKSGNLCPKVERRIGFPYSPEMVERSRRSVGATLAACQSALADGVAINLAGGTHHAFADRGEGFCVFNDTAVALWHLKSHTQIERALVIDTDVHQGNGTAALLAPHPDFFTLSIHGAKNFPFRKENSDLDVPLPDGVEDQEYLESLEAALKQISDQFSPDFVLFQSGADPYWEDKLGRLALTKQGLLKRDRMVFDWCHQAGLPVAVTMGGGYAPQVEDIVSIHLQTVQEAARSYSRSRSAASSARLHLQAG